MPLFFCSLRSETFQNEHEEQKTKISKLVEKYLLEQRKTNDKISGLDAMKEDEKEESRRQKKFQHSKTVDVDVIEYSCDFCDFKSHDSTVTQLHQHQKHQS